MNVNQTSGRMYDQLRASNHEVIELKQGQVITGELLHILDEQEQDVLLRIQSAVVRAKLETNLPLGKSAEFQVQPNGPKGELVLKRITRHAPHSNPDSLSSLLRTFQLMDTVKNRLVIQTMQQNHLPLTREHVENIVEVLGKRPNHTTVSTWLQAAVSIGQRGLPMTMSFVSAMHSIISGPPLHQTIRQLHELMTTELQLSSADHTPQVCANTRPVLEALNESLRQLIAVSTTMTQGITTQASVDATASSMAHRQRPEAKVQPVAKPYTVPGAKIPGLPPVAAKQSTTARTVAETIRTRVSSVSRLSSQVRVPLDRQQFQRIQSVGDHNGVTDYIQRQTEQIVDHSMGKENKPLMWQLMHLLGIARSVPRTEQKSELSLFRSVQNLLLQLQTLESTPHALQGKAKQLMQQLSGQQLLLSSDRNAPFVHVTFIIPLFDEHGEQTTAVSMQARKTTSGGLDTNHCRLLFDLHMQTIGPVIVDVNIVDQRVQLRIFNDYPALEVLLEASEASIAKVMKQLGMKLMSVQLNDYPDLEQQAHRQLSVFSPEPYKGVDLRI